MKTHLNNNIKRIPKNPQIIEVEKKANELKIFKIRNHEKIKNSVDSLHMESMARL